MLDLDANFFGNLFLKISINNILFNTKAYKGISINKSTVFTKYRYKIYMLILEYKSKITIFNQVTGI